MLSFDFQHNGDGGCSGRKEEGEDFQGDRKVVLGGNKNDSGHREMMGNR